MRYPLVFLSALLLTAPARAQSSGVLLGLRAGERSPLAADTVVPSYRSLWIATIAGKLTVAAELPTVVVPRNDGFWRIDIERSCGITDEAMEMHGPFVDDYSEAVWRRLGSPRTFRPGDRLMDCADARRKVPGMRSDTIDVASDIEPCNVRDVVVTYASPQYVSYDTYGEYTEFCSPDRYTSRTYLSVVDSMQHSPSLLQALSPARSVAVRERWQSARTDCTFEETPDENWGIVRGVGEWVTAFASSGPTVCRGDGMAEFDIRERIPRSIARSEPVEWLSRVRSAVADVSDFFVSPTGDLICVRSGNRLDFFTAKGGTLVGPLLWQYTLRADERVILVEWATGSHVARWTRELSQSPK